MPNKTRTHDVRSATSGADIKNSSVRKQEELRISDMLQTAIDRSRNFAVIATDAKGVIQKFNAGAERLLGYTAEEVVNKLTPADIADQQQIIARAKLLSAQFDNRITSQFEALVFNAMRGIEDSFEMNCVRKDHSHIAALLSVIALRNDCDSIVGYLFHLTEITARKPEDSENPQTRHSLMLHNKQPHSLLYIEDNPANMQLVEQFVARQPGIRFLTAVNGHSGMLISRSEKPDVILLDINLPDMSGFKVLGLLQADSSTRHIPVIALSANNLPINIDSGLVAGFFRYLTKPYKLDEFVDALDAAFQVAEQRTSKNKLKIANP